MCRSCLGEDGEDAALTKAQDGPVSPGPSDKHWVLGRKRRRGARDGQLGQVTVMETWGSGKKDRKPGGLQAGSPVCLSLGEWRKETGSVAGHRLRFKDWLCH